MSKSVRVATRYDIDVMAQFMLNYQKYSPIEALKTEPDIKHLKTLLTSIVIGAGIAFIAERDDEPAGMIMGMKSPSIWNPNVVLLQELAWWVEPQHRNTMIGYRLIDAYKKYAIEQLQNKRIHGWTLSKMTNSPDMDYSKLDLKKIEETWLGE